MHSETSKAHQYCLLLCVFRCSVCASDHFCFDSFCRFCSYILSNCISSRPLFVLKQPAWKNRSDIFQWWAPTIACICIKHSRFKSRLTFQLVALKNVSHFSQISTRTYETLLISLQAKVFGNRGGVLITYPFLLHVTIAATRAWGQEAVAVASLRQ